MTNASLSDEELKEVYLWVDEIPLSRPKKNITRDFSDGVMVAEIIAHYFPQLVELHNYVSSFSASKKMYNWQTLNRKLLVYCGMHLYLQYIEKVLKKIGFALSKEELDGVVNCVPNVIELVLFKMKQRLEHMQSGESSTINAKPDSISTSNNVGASQKKNEKDDIIQELKETIEILEIKVTKLEHLLALKNEKIQTLETKLNIKSKQYQILNFHVCFSIHTFTLFFFKKAICDLLSVHCNLIYSIFFLFFKKNYLIKFHAGIPIEVIHDILYSQAMIEEEKLKMKNEIENQICATTKAIKCFLPPQANKRANTNSN